MKMLQDSGVENRLSKIGASNLSGIQELLDIQESYRFGKHDKKGQYRKYFPYAKRILHETDNFKEKAYIFDNQENIILVKTGYEDRICFTEKELSNFKDNYLIHNHPSGNSLSLADCYLLFDSNLKEIIAFSNKMVFYKLAINKEVNKEEFLDTFLKEKRKVSILLKSLIKNGTITKLQAEKELQHMILSMVAHSMKGVTYERKQG